MSTWRVPIRLHYLYYDLWHRKLHTSWPAITTTNTRESPEADVSLIHGIYFPINLSTSIYGTS